MILAAVDVWVTAGASIVVAVIVPFVAVWAKRIERSTRPNGSGTIIEIAERTEEKVDKLARSLARHVDDPDAHQV